MGNMIIALAGNGIPQCWEIAQYNFPTDLIPSCLDENGILIKNESININL